MNTIIQREFLPIKEGETRKRWFATVQCQQCSKIFTIREQPKALHLNKPCEECSRKNIAYGKFIEKSLKKHGNRFDYSLITKDSYKDLFTPVDIICKKHGVFQQKPKDHTSNANGKQCCPKCIYEFNILHNKKSISEWKEELQTKTPHITISKHGNSDSNTEKCTLSCEHHGEFETILARIKSGSIICPKCVAEKNAWNTRHTREDIKGIVYFIHIPEINHYKLGVTTTSVDKRLSTLEHDYTVLCTLEMPTAKEAYALEQKLFKLFKDFRPYSKYVKPTLFNCFGGYTELLSSTLPSKRFIEEILCRKESNSGEPLPSNVEGNPERSLDINQETSRD